MEDDLGLESPLPLLKWLVKEKRMNINKKDNVRRRQSCGDNCMIASLNLVVGTALIRRHPLSLSPP